MTRVEFHFNVPDRLGYACRLLRKAYRAGARVTVTGPRPVLSSLDRQLWTFEPTEFVPHVMLPGEKAAELRDRTPVVLAEDAEQPGRHEVLLHLGDDPVVGFESFERLIEVVSLEPVERDAARSRWKHYASRGYAIKRHDLQQEEPR